MAIEVKIPPMGESITSGVLSKWHVADGAVVKKDQPLFELETDKITSEGTAETAGILVAEGEVARRDGEVAKTLTALTRATTAAPADDRGWFALGRAQNEREDTVPARRHLAKAIELNPAGAGYAGELGTLETFANRFDEAQKAFQAWAVKPDKVKY